MSGNAPDPEGGAGEVLGSLEELTRRFSELRSRPGFPKGGEESILAMSLPPHYTACPNPFMGDWIKETAPNGDDAPHEDPGPFAADISEGKQHPLYRAHSYPTKVPHQAIMRYILHYTRPGQLVLDGFCGTGMMGVAAQACGSPEPEFRYKTELEMGTVRWGPRRAVLQDLSPWATFIAAGVNLPIDAGAFDRRSKEILDRFDQEWGWMYETRHGDGRSARIEFTVWSEVFTCPHCGGELVFYEAAFDATTGHLRDTFLCPGCGAGLSKNLLERRRVPVRTLLGDVVQRIEFRPVRIHYRVGKTRYEKSPDDGDLEVLLRIASVRVPPFPGDLLPYMHMTHERNNLPGMGFTHVHHLFSDRALAALAVLWSWCSAEEDPAFDLPSCSGWSRQSGASRG